MSHLLINNLIFGSSATVSLDGLYTPEPVLTGEHLYTEHVDVIGGFPLISLEFDVLLLTPDSHLVISLLVTVIGTCEYLIHGPILLNLLSGLNYHASININPLNPAQVLYVNCTSDERLLILSGLHSGPVLFLFTLAHDDPPPPDPLTLQHLDASFGYELDFTLGEGYVPPEVGTSDHFSSDDLEGSNPLIPSATVDFDVDLLTPDGHMQISGLVVQLPSGCTYTFHPALLLNLVAALTYRVEAAVNGVTQVLFAGCTSQEIQLVQLYYAFGNDLVMEFVLAH